LSWSLHCAAQRDAQAATGGAAQPINVVADAGYSNGEKAEACEAKGILPHVPANRSVNNHGDGTLFRRTEFTYQPESDVFLCPAGQTLARKQLSRKDRAILYAAQPEVCGACSLKPRCTVSSRRMITRHLHDEALQRMQQRAPSEAMRLRRSTVEHPFANLKYRIFGQPRFLLRGLRVAQTEISLGVAAYNLKRMQNILGGRQLTSALRTA
jgi:Transposase DDE domain